MTVLAPDELVFEGLHFDVTCDTEGCGKEAVAMAVFQVTCCRPGFLVCPGCRDRISELAHVYKWATWKCHFCDATLIRLLRMVPI